jgi:tetratricopeptide (TPR) repeat protein
MNATTYTDRVSPPSPHELMARHVRRNAEMGLNETILPEMGEVIPHEARLGIRVDAQQAWNAASKATECFTGKRPKTPSADWVRLAQSVPGVMALPFAVGLFPQMVTPLDRLIDHKPGRPFSQDIERASTGLIERFHQKAAEPDLSMNEFLLAVNCLRLVGAFEEALSLLNHRLKLLASDAECEMVQNEIATTLWFQGNFEAAQSIWLALKSTAVVEFNLGMSDLFAGRVDKGHEHLQQAMNLLEEDDPWFHLAGLYLTIA